MTTRGRWRTTRRNSGAAATLFTAAVLAAACGTAVACGDDDVVGPRTDPDDLRLVERWDLLRIERPQGDVEPVEGPRGVPSLSFTEEDFDTGGLRVNGDSGCNLGGGGYVAEENGRLSFNDLAWTEMACLEPGIMTVEQIFFEALTTVDAFRVGPEGLALELEFGGGTLVFGAPPEAG